MATDSSTTTTENPTQKDDPLQGEEENATEDWQVQRDYHKQQGDRAFKCHGYKTAIDEYTKAIDFDPELVTLYSNRSAAYLKNGEKSKALKDAEKCVELDPTFAKGYSRLAAALHSLKRYEKAKQAYEQVLKLDAHNVVAKQGIEDCQREIEESEKRRKQHMEEMIQDVAPGTAITSKETDASADGDDLLDDFFNEVAEVAKKKPKEDVQPEATNAIRNDREVLGTSKDQIERLLASNYEWRNLNPFYVLQLPSTATEDDINRRYKALSLLLHPDKNGGSERAQLAYDQVQKAKTTLNDPDRARHARMLIEEGMKQGEHIWAKSDKKKAESLESVQEKEIMRIFAQIEMKRREVEQRERKYEQRERAHEAEAEEKERKSRQFDKQWRDEERVDKRVGNWRTFEKKKKRKTT